MGFVWTSYTQTIHMLYSNHTPAILYPYSDKGINPGKALVRNDYPFFLHFVTSLAGEPKIK
jgi:hypothetical protein